MSKHPSSMASLHPLNQLGGDHPGGSDDGLDPEAATDDGHGGYLEHELWDAFEIDDDDPQPEYGDFWYEEESIE